MSETTVYVPPQKQKLLSYNPSSVQYQKQTWEILKKSLNGHINKLSTTNIKHILPEILSENLIRGRGAFIRSVMKAQSVSGGFTDVYAAAVAVINTKFPMIGELLAKRLVFQFRRGYTRNDKQVCLSTTKFLAHLMNQKVVHEVISLQLLTLLLERPTNDSVEVAVAFMKEAGAYLLAASPRATNAIFERFRAILHEGEIDKRTQYMVEVLFQVYRDGFKEYPSIKEELDLVEEDEQITHNISLDDEIDTEEALNVFQYDEKYEENEKKYLQIKKEILGDESDDEAGEESEEETDEETEIQQVVHKKMKIQDETNTNLINLRRAIYLTIMSSLNFEETAHKLSKLQVPDEHQIELCNMIVECCSQERTYVSFYGLLGERFCRMNPLWAQVFMQCFEETYKTIHRYETNRLRNIAKYYAHLLGTDALSWEVFMIVRLTEDDTTGLKNLKSRLEDTSMTVRIETEKGMEMKNVFDGLFPMDHPRNTRFAINYFTSIGLGVLTEGMREWLKNAPKMLVEKQAESDSSSDDSDSDSSDSGSSDSDSDDSDSSRSS